MKRGKQSTWIGAFVHRLAIEPDLMMKQEAGEERGEGVIEASARRAEPRSAKRPAEMARAAYRLFAALVVVPLLGLLLAFQPARAETYTSFDANYPSTFGNWDGQQHNDAHYMDAVYFGGRELYFFTLISTESDYSEYLYFYCNDPAYHGSVNITNSSALDFRIKLVAANDLLYVFYTAAASASNHNTNTIYYRTASVNQGTYGTNWFLQFSDEKTVFTNLGPVTIRTAQIMDETLYVIFSVGDNWYSVAASDGVAVGLPTFGPRTQLFTASNVKGAGGAVFQVPSTADTNDLSLDRLMLAYVTGASPLHYYFFDGTNCHGPYSMETTGFAPSSVRLLAGSAQGYTNTLYSIQVFITHDQDATWHDFLHREYIPAGTNGADGSWSASWNRLSTSSADAAHCYPDHASDSSWAVIPTYASASADVTNNVQSYVRLWYARGTHLHTWEDTVNMRCSSYLSDVLVHQPTMRAGPEKQYLSSSMVLGVIEGTPPYPLNEGIQTNSPVPHNYSAVDFAYHKESSYQTAWSVGGGVMVYGGKKVLGNLEASKVEEKGSWKAKWSSAVKYTKTTETSSSRSSSKEFKNFDGNPPGELAWLVVLKPEIVNDPYILRAYDEHPLAFSGDASGNEVYISLLTYGASTLVDYVAYYLNEPSQQYGTTNQAPLLEGMAVRPRDTNLHGDPTDPGDVSGTGWIGLNDYYRQDASTAPWTVIQLQTTNAAGLTPLILTGSAGVAGTYEYTYSTTVANTEAGDEHFSFSGENVGVVWTGGAGITLGANFKSSTATTLTAELGFAYEFPECCSKPPCEYQCVSSTMIYPVLLVPRDDDSGFTASWISNDIRNNKKPKPWCLTYWTYDTTEVPPKLKLLPSGSPSEDLLRLILTGVPGASYEIQTSVDLKNWTRYSTVTLSNGSTAEVSITPATEGPHRFYRTRQL